jgi:hypothetical protein
MDPITTAILAAIPALATDIVKTSVRDAYQGFKAIIRRKWGEKGAATAAVDALEKDPESQSRAIDLAKSIAAVRATEDTDIMQALAALVDELKREAIGGHAVADIDIAITGGVVQGVVGSSRVSVGSMSFQNPSSNKQ